jgi:hypothetical protein
MSKVLSSGFSRNRQDLRARLVRPLLLGGMANDSGCSKNRRFDKSQAIHVIGAGSGYLFTRLSTEDGEELSIAYSIGLLMPLNRGPALKRDTS